MTAPSTPEIRIQRWPLETPLRVFVGLISAMIWLGLAFTIVGLIYVFFLGVFFFVGHLIFITHIRGSSVKLGPDQLPELHQAVERLAHRIGFTKAPDTYLMEAGGALNALATKLFKANMIVLYSDLITACGDNTAARDMIIAHELGHLKEGHLEWHWFFLPGKIIPFLGTALSRAQEYTCDRYGMAGAGDVHGALRGLAILAGGAEKGPKINLQAMAQQVEDLNTGWMTLGTWLSSHPSLAQRLIALEQQLRPVGYTNQPGIMRALGIIGIAYILPMILIGGLASIFIVRDLAAKRNRPAAYQIEDGVSNESEENLEDSEESTMAK